MKKLNGEVISLKMNKTAVVRVDRTRMHKVYKKRLTLSSRYMVHTDTEVQVGDIVEIVETRPISKNKNWKLVKVIK